MTLREVSKTPLSIYFWFFQVVIVLSLASVVVWLSLIPKYPIFTITNVHIPALVGHNSTHHPNEVIQNSSIIFNLEISNPNKGIGIYYDDIRITIYYNDTALGVKSIMAFCQGVNKTLLRNVIINGDQKFWSGISSGNVDLRVAIETALRYRIFLWKTKHHRVDREARVIIGPEGMILGEKSIELHILVEGNGK